MSYVKENAKTLLQKKDFKLPLTYLIFIVQNVCYKGKML